MYPFKALDVKSRINVSFPFSGAHSDVEQILRDAFISAPFALSPIGHHLLVDFIYKRRQGCSFGPSQVLR